MTEFFTKTSYFLRFVAWQSLEPANTSLPDNSELSTTKETPLRSFSGREIPPKELVYYVGLLFERIGYLSLSMNAFSVVPEKIVFSIFGKSAPAK
jgi:hypothetical protein